MSMMKRLAKRYRAEVTGILWMVVGSSLVFALLVTMNRFNDAPQMNEENASASFEVIKQEKKKKPKPKKPPVRKRNMRKSKQPPPPMPQFASGLSGVDVGLPLFDAAGVEDVEETLLGDISDVVMTSDSVDKAPTPAAAIDIEYPPRARMKGLEGFVVLSLLLNANGIVEQVKVLESNPPGVFEQAALQAARNMRFNPAMYKGKPVRIWVKQPIEFKLQ